MGMMIDGRLRWSKKRNGGWYTFAHDNEERFYTAEKIRGGWGVYVGIRFSPLPPKQLGWYVYLKDAKYDVDFHHHQMIAESNNENLKAYIGRFPLEQLGSAGV